MEAIANSKLKHYSLLPRIKNEVQSAVPGAEVIVYGSVARGEATEDSDIDLLIIIDQDTIPMALRERIYERTTNIELEEGVIISLILRTRRQWVTPAIRTPFMINVNNEGRWL